MKILTNSTGIVAKPMEVKYNPFGALLWPAKYGSNFLPVVVNWIEIDYSLTPLKKHNNEEGRL